MSWAIEEMLNIVWCLVTVGADVEAIILTDAGLVGAKEYTIYLCELINKKEAHVNTRLGTDHHQLIMPPISKDLTLFLSVHSFMLLHANGTN